MDRATIKIAIFRPRWARNNTAFEVQARLYKYIQSKYNIDFTIFADEENHFRYKDLRVVDIPRNKTWIHNQLRRFGLSFKSEYPQWRLLKGFDIIETSDPTLYEYTYTALIAAKKYDSRLVCGSSVTLKSLTHNDTKLAKQIMDHSYRICCCTPKAQERFQQLGVLENNSHRVVITGHPIDTTLFKPQELSAARNGPVKIISVGRIEEDKGHRFILNALINILQQGLCFQWDIIGSGNYESKLKQEITKHNLNHLITFHGNIPNEQLPKYYANSDIFVLHPITTLYAEEAFGVAFAEAMSCGLPVLATNTGGIPFVVKNNQTGILVDQKNIKQLTHALRRLIDSKKLRKEMGNAAVRHINNNFSNEVVALKYLKLWGIDI